MRRVDDGRSEPQTAATKDELTAWRVLAGLAVVGWFCVLLIGLAGAMLILVLDWGYCERGDSVYGELRWSLLPPGPTCTWTLEADGFDARQGPTAVMSIWLATLVAGGLIAWLLVRRARFGQRTITNAWRAAGVMLAFVGFIALLGATMVASSPLLWMGAGMFVCSVLAWSLGKRSREVQSAPPHQREHQRPRSAALRARWLERSATLSFAQSSSTGAWVRRHWHHLLVFAAAVGVTFGAIAYVNGRWFHVPLRPQAETPAGSVAFGVASFFITVLLLVVLVGVQSWRRERRRPNGSRRPRT